jgi:hypothetical protein
VILTRVSRRAEPGGIPPYHTSRRSVLSDCIARNDGPDGLLFCGHVRDSTCTGGLTYPRATTVTVPDDVAELPSGNIIPFLMV